jgi:DHA1 family tetracycline resistance protein-like MFS transporter
MNTISPSPAPTSSGRTPAVGFIFITLLLDVIGLGIIIPVIPKLIEELTGEGLSKAAEYGGWLLFSYAICQFLFAPVIGGLSDRYGRRPVLLGSLLGFGFDYLLLAVAPTLSWLFIGRILSGILGASFTTGAAYIADVSTPEKRAQNFGMIGAAFGLGFIIGPVLGGVLGAYGSRIPFYAAAVLTLLNAAYGYFILPESLAPENRRPFEWKRANPLGSLLNLRRYPSVLALVGTLFFVYLASHAVQGTWAYVTMERYGWTEKEVGWSLGIVGVLNAVVQGLLIRVLLPKLGNKRAVFLGMSLWLLGMILFVFASQGWMLLVFLIPYALGGISGPAIQGLISGQVLPSEQGELQGALTSLMSATSIVGPPLMTQIFAYFTRPGAAVYFPAAPFVAGSVLLVGAVGMLYVKRARLEGN